MSFDLALLSPLSGLLGGLLGGGASLVAAIYRHRSQDRLQRIAAEMTKREAVYAEFVMYASNLLLRAYTRDEIEISADAQRLMGLISRMRFFAPAKVIATAESVLRAIVEISLKPSLEPRQLATEALNKNMDPDPLLKFSLVCRADLDSLHRTTR